MTLSVTTHQPADLAQRQAVSESANAHAAAGAFEDYTSRKADNTTRRQLAELTVFAEYLIASGFYDESQPAAERAAALQTTGAAWAGMTFGMVEGFTRWQLQQGYAIGTINIRLSTVKRYAGLAFKAGAIDHTDYALIKIIQGYTRKEAKHVNEDRPQTRRADAKKADPVLLSDGQADALKGYPNRKHYAERLAAATPQDRRDAVLMTILLDHGLRVGELVLLQVKHIDFEARQITAFYRPKVDAEQTIKLSDAAYTALLAWRDSGDMPLAADAPLLRGSRKGDGLTNAGMTERTINNRVRKLGAALGIAHLGPHDCRHYWASYWAARVEKLPRGLFTLQEAGGWSSLAMPRRYVERAKIANEGMA